MNLLLISVPAMAALFFKGCIFLYARFSRAHSKQTQLYLLFLFGLGIQNIGEVQHFFDISAGRIPGLSLDIFYLGSIAAIAFAFHLANSLVFPGSRTLEWISRGIYMVAVVMGVLFVSTDLFRQGYQLIGYSATRIPGPLYWIFVIYAMGVLAWYLGVLLFGALTAKSMQQRARHWLMWAAILPIAIVAIGILTSLQLGYKSVNATILMPFAITFFLAVTAYAIHTRRIFDIRFFVPGAGTRKSKKKLYSDLDQCARSLRSEQPRSAADLAQKLFATLDAPVAILSTRRSFKANHGQSSLADFPLHDLRHVHEVTVFDESDCPLREPMRKYQCGVIVPFMVEGRGARGWLLVHMSLLDRVYTPRDFRALANLFSRVRALFCSGAVWQSYRLHDEVREMERELLIHALSRAQGNQAQAARWLGIPPSTLHFKLERYGLREEINKLTTVSR